MIKTILFDLDGTLLPMDLDVFLKDYLTRFTAAMARVGRSPEAFTKAVWAATAAMSKNDGSCTNEAAFWNAFTATGIFRMSAGSAALSPGLPRQFRKSKPGATG